MLSFLRDSGIPFAIVLTKADKLNKSETEMRRAQLKTELEGFEGVPVIEFSVVTGIGAEELKSVIINSKEV